ncbi:GNAT family N-acetyltransferase [Roseibium aestuarii]|uniref:GNAT family N-acetyltransferase n=1 Tax=Roseibium aestuarii TaxID=2600299 RepID=A0ABW4JYS9_9HYPH|nr:N-acetyltransferase [Roseibium aestuarii]
MKPSNWFVRLEEAADEAAVEAMQAEAFGPGRYARTAFKVREGFPHSADLSLIGMTGDRIAGSVRLTPILIGDTPAQLLGPLTVDPVYKNRGLGKLLLATVEDMARAQGETAILLVGDAPYYGPSGYKPVPFGKIALPGPVDPARLLILQLTDAPMPEGAVRGALR